MAKLRVGTLRQVELRSCLLALCVIGVAAACSRDRYQLIETKDGRELRLDKSSGAMVGVEAESLPKIREEHDADYSRDTVLARAHQWPTEILPIPKDHKAAAIFSTACREGRLFYRFNVLAESDLRDGATGLIPRFTLTAVDKDDFALMEIEVPLREMAVGDSKVSENFAFTYRATTKCEPETYRRVNAWDISWNF